MTQPNSDKSQDDAARPSGSVPLFVDLDGTLSAADTLYESLMWMVRHRTLSLLALPLWLAGGKSHTKRQIALRTELNVATLPYRAEVLELIRLRRREGCRIVLVTAADMKIARAVADHLRLFDAVLASDGSVNLSGRRKLQAIREQVGVGEFHYIGDSRADLPIWLDSGEAMIVAHNPRVVRDAERQGKVTKIAEPAPPRFRDVLHAMRIHQWVKNLLLLLPVVLSHQWAVGSVVANALLAFLAFGFCVSSVYVLNDLLDLESDRQHLGKSRRPMASGRLGIPAAIQIGVISLLTGLLICVIWLPHSFTAMVLAYLAATTLYSMRLKTIPVLDVFVLAGFYAYRVLAGAVVIHAVISPWLLAFSMFFFLSLAMVKRYSDLVTHQGQSRQVLPGRGYNADDAEILHVLGPTSAYISVLVLTLYINSADVMKLYKHPDLLWLICPCLLYWFTRVWFIAHRGQMPHDPILFAAKDIPSYLLVLITLLIIVFATI